MFNTLLTLKAQVQSFLQNEKGVVAFEYLLVIAGVSVAIIFAVAFAAPSLINNVVTATCTAMQTVLPAGAMDCIAATILSP